MSSLKDLIWEEHKAAETRPFVKVLFSGKIHPELYATYLWNQFPQYEVLEMFAMRAGLLNDMPDIARAKKIYADFLELWPHKDRNPQVCDVVDDYVNYIKDIADDKDKLLAHMYVRHFGDLSGGQMIAKRVPGSGQYYQFGDDPEAIKEAIRPMLTDELAEEAKVCFNFAARMFDEMMDFVEE
jgi:heme oxygenase